MIGAQQQIGSLQVSMDDVILVQIIHTLGDVNSNPNNHRDLQSVLLLVKKVI